MHIIKFNAYLESTLRDKSPFQLLFKYGEWVPVPASYMSFHCRFFNAIIGPKIIKIVSIKLGGYLLLCVV